MGPAWVEPVLSKDKCVLFDDTTSRMKHSTAEPQKMFWGLKPVFEIIYYA